MKSNRCKRTDKPNSTENRIHIGKYDRNAREIRANIIVNAIFCCSCAIMEFPTAFIFHWRISFTLLHHINGAIPNIHLNSLNLTDRVRNICRNHSQRVTLALSIIQFRKLFCNFNANEIQLDLSNWSFSELMIMKIMLTWLICKLGRKASSQRAKYDQTCCLCQNTAISWSFSTIPNCKWLKRSLC